MFLSWPRFWPCRNEPLFPSIECLVGLGPHFATSDSLPLNLLAYLLKQDSPSLLPIKLLISFLIIEHGFERLVAQATEFFKKNQEEKSGLVSAFTLALEGTIPESNERIWWLAILADCYPTLLEDKTVDINLRESLAIHLETVQSNQKEVLALKQVAIDLVSNNPSLRFEVIPDFKQTKALHDSWYVQVDKNG